MPIPSLSINNPFRSQLDIGQFGQNGPAIQDVPEMPMQSGGLPQGPSLSPTTSGPFSMPERTDLDQISHYNDFFSDPRFQSLIRRATRGPSQLDSIIDTMDQYNWGPARAALGIGGKGRAGSSLAERHAQEQKDAAKTLSALSGAWQNNQQGLQSNTAAYGNIEEAYAKERQLPYVLNHLFQQSEQARTAAGQNIAETQTENALRQPQVSSELERGYQRHQAGLASEASAGALGELEAIRRELRGPQVATAKNRQTITGEEAAVAPEFNKYKTANQKRLSEGTPPGSKTAKTEEDKRTARLQQDIDDTEANIEALKAATAGGEKKSPDKTEYRKNMRLLTSEQARLETRKRQLGSAGKTKVASQPAAEADFTDEGARIAPTDPAQREIGQIYDNGKGRKAKWMGNGWQALP